MNLTSQHIFWIGSGITLIFFMVVYLKLHRRKHVLISLFIIGLISFLIGLKLLSNPNYKMEIGHAATAFFSPIIYISVYNSLRLIFKRITGVEPTYEFASDYDKKDKRGLSIFDYIVYILPFLIAVTVPLYFG